MSKLFQGTQVVLEAEANYSRRMEAEQQQNGGVVVAVGWSWRLMFRPRIVAALLSPLLLLVNVALIATFVLQENWHAVALTAVVFLAVAQVTYWYFRARTIIETRQQVEVLPLFLDPVTLTPSQCFHRR